MAPVVKAGTDEWPSDTIIDNDNDDGNDDDADWWW